MADIVLRKGSGLVLYGAYLVGRFRDHWPLKGNRYDRLAYEVITAEYNIST